MQIICKLFALKFVIWIYKYTHAHTEIYTIHKWEEYEFSHVIQMEKIISNKLYTF